MENSMQGSGIVNCAHKKGFIRILTFFAAIGGFLFGYDTGVISGAMLLLKQHFFLDLFWQELVVSVTLLFAIIFALIGGPLNNAYGRRIVILLSSFIFAAGSIVLAAATDKYMLLIGRGIVGIGIGLASMTVPMYIAEVSPPEIRGRLVTLNNIFITAGQFIASCVDGAFSSYDNGWRLMLGLAAVPAFIQFIGFIFLPESPRWLIQKNKIDKAVIALQRVFVHDAKVNSEIENLKDAFERETKNRPKGNMFLLMIREDAVRKALVVGCGMQMIQQLSGINTVMYYSATILQMSGVRDDQRAIWLAAAVAFINFICTFIGLWLVERAGRRKLTLWSLAGVILSLLLLATGFLLSYINSPSVITHSCSIECKDFQSCGSCMQAIECGFCYVEESSNHSITNSTCVLANADSQKPFNTTCVSSSDHMTEEYHTYFAYNYCPTSYSWIVLLGMVMYLLFFAPGMGPMPWTVNSEIYPQWCRGTAISYSTATNWIFNLLVSLTFLHVTEAFTYQGAFLLYAALAVIGFIFLFCMLPETQGKALEEIQHVFRSGWLVSKRRKSYQVILNNNEIESSDDEEDPLFIR